MKCTAGKLTGNQCSEKASWVNQNGVRVCGYHKLLLDAFTWEPTDKKTWTPVDIAENNDRQT